MSEKTESLEPNSHSSNQQKSQIGLSIASDAIQFGFWLQKYLHYFYHFRSSQATETCQAHACSIFMNLMKSCRIVVLLLPSKSQDLNLSLWKLESEFEVTSPTLFFFFFYNSYIPNLMCCWKCFFHEINFPNGLLLLVIGKWLGFSHFPYKKDHVV